MSAAGAQGAFLLHCGNRRAVETGLIDVDDTGLRMRGSLSAWRHSRLATAASRSADRTQSTVAPVASRAQYKSHQPPVTRTSGSSTRQDLWVGLSCRPVALNPSPDGRVIRLQAALAERERVPKYTPPPPPRTAHSISSSSVCRHLQIAGRIACFMISSGHQPPSATVATPPHDLVFGQYEVSSGTFNCAANADCDNPGEPDDRFASGSWMPTALTLGHV